ncbi:MAG: RdgB/HAM1 family non-canonical purine NTP pyrophosphatase [Defluviitaleaceae bacterium]|nr:RdgB/HAM1 family non-canonical purine NTP pyrophosphatase [Defluviitaleaceae bacterium]
MVFATNNKNKANELSEMLRAEGVNVKTLSALGLILVPGEDGNTFEANALQKATETSTFLKKMGHLDEAIIADDSGLEIDAMDGEPGVDSALFMGENTPYEIRNAEIIRRLEGVPKEKRTARFVCVIACALPTGETFTTRGVIEGEIAHKPQGENGFGYDPIFFVPSLGKTTAQLSSKEKNKISHRGQALRAMVAKLKGDGLV